jgi:L,D-transpeptidase catalytic domain
LASDLSLDYIFRHLMRSLTVTLAILALAPATPALAAGASKPATTPPPAVVAKAKPTTIKLKLVNPLRARGFALVLVRRAFLVRGYVSHYAAGQTVSVHAYRNGKRFSAKKAKLRHGPHGSGRFFAYIQSYGEGKIGVTAVHHHTAKLGSGTSKALRVRSYWPTSTARPVVSLLQRKLAAEKYAVRQSGYFDSRTGRALLAFRKVNGMARTESPSTFIMHQLLAGRGAYQVRFKTHGRHVEGDLTHQVIALVDSGGKVHAVYPVSSGKPSTPTVLGHFHVYRRDPGTNAEGMVHSSYFIRGYAVHGYYSVPAYAASHGCLRVPVPDSLGIYDWIRFGTPVDVFYR